MQRIYGKRKYREIYAEIDSYLESVRPRTSAILSTIFLPDEVDELMADLRTYSQYDASAYIQSFQRAREESERLEGHCRLCHQTLYDIYYNAMMTHNYMQIKDAHRIAMDIMRRVAVENKLSR